MRITESRLRKIIRSVILESLTDDQIKAGIESEEGWDAWESPKKKGIKLRTGKSKPARKGIKLRVNRKQNYNEDDLILNFREHAGFENVIEGGESSPLFKSLNPSHKSVKEYLIEYKIVLAENADERFKKDTTKNNSFVGPLIGEPHFLVRYKGNVFAVDVKFKYPEDRYDHLKKIKKDLIEKKFHNMTSNTNDF